MKKMKKKVFLAAIAALVIITTSAQTGRKVNNIQLKDVNDAAKFIPFLGEKMIVLFYVDPDVQDITDPLIDSLNARKFPNEKLVVAGIVNCKDTWIPNSAIFSKARQKQRMFPNSYVLLDKSYIMPDSWGLGNCNDKAMLIVIGKDSKIRFSKNIGSKAECGKYIREIMQLIETEITIK